MRSPHLPIPGGALHPGQKQRRSRVSDPWEQLEPCLAPWWWDAGPALQTALQIGDSPQQLYRTACGITPHGMSEYDVEQGVSVAV
jgi:hypothetical protein